MMRHAGSDHPGRLHLFGRRVGRRGWFGIPSGLARCRGRRHRRARRHGMAWPPALRKRAATIGRQIVRNIFRRLKIGVHLIGDDYANSPPAHILATKGIVDNVVDSNLSRTVVSHWCGEMVMQTFADAGQIDYYWNAKVT